MNDLQITIANLEKIHVELPILAEAIPSIRGEFDMKVLGCYDKSTLDNLVCRTYGCGLGNAARLFDLSKGEYYNARGEFSYFLFSQGILPSLTVTPILLDYLFSSKWGCSYSNYKTFEDFIQRMGNMIQLLKKKGACIVWFDPEESNDLAVV